VKVGYFPLFFAVWSRPAGASNYESQVRARWLGNSAPGIIDKTRRIHFAENCWRQTATSPAHKTMSHEALNLTDNGLKIGPCPRCGHLPAESGFIQWADVARVSNVAEAGFLAAELIGIGIESRVQQLDDFSAASDRWSSKYLIRVPEQFAREASGHIEQYLYEDDHRGRPLLDVMRKPFLASASESISWRPVILVVIAGIASFALGQRLAEQSQPRRPAAHSLLNAIAVLNKRFTTEPVANQPRHRLSFDQQQQQWTLETDRDNDGTYDEAQDFPAAPVR
jgi:hypothetical protein